MDKFFGNVCINFNQKYVRLGLLADVFKTKKFTLALMNKWFPMFIQYKPTVNLTKSNDIS